MAAALQETTHGNWPALKLGNQHLQMTVVPALGGKITSLRSLASKREWLWKNPHLSQQDPCGQTDYVGKFDTGGWDEVFPTVNPCRLRGTPWGTSELTDHGEIWRRSAKVVASEVTDASASVTLRVEGDPLPFVFDRTIILAAASPCAEIAYQLTNHADAPLPYLWAMHPLVAAEFGMRIELPAGCRFKFAGGVGGQLPIQEKWFDWPISVDDCGGRFDASIVPKPVGGAGKFFTAPLQQTMVAVTSSNQRESVRWKVQSEHHRCYHVGLWINFAGWSGCGSTNYYNLAIEPTTSPCDSLADAIEQNLAPSVPPRGNQRWKVTTTLTQDEGVHHAI